MKFITTPYSSVVSDYKVLLIILNDNGNINEGEVGYHYCISYYDPQVDITWWSLIAIDEYKNPIIVKSGLQYDGVVLYLQGVIDGMINVIDNMSK